MQGKVVGLPATVNEFRFGRWRYRQTLTLDVWGATRWPGMHRIRVNAYELPVQVKADQRLALMVKLKAPRGVYNATGVDAARRARLPATSSHDSTTSMVGAHSMPRV